MGRRSTRSEPTAEGKLVTVRVSNIYQTCRLPLYLNNILLSSYSIRVIVDEGHVMGKNTNNLIQFASWLTGERHWGMTGTPTSQIATQNGLKNLYYLANFLRHGKNFVLVYE